MKTRTGFVSNSSSCSFVVYKAGLTKEQIDLIENFEDTYVKYCELCKAEVDEDGEPAYLYPHDVQDIEGWSMTDEGNKYDFHTVMDNADLVSAFEKFGIPVSEVGEW